MHWLCTHRRSVSAQQYSVSPVLPFVFVFFFFFSFLLASSAAAGLGYNGHEIVIAPDRTYNWVAYSAAHLPPPSIPTFWGDNVLTVEPSGSRLVTIGQARSLATAASTSSSLSALSASSVPATSTKLTSSTLAAAPITVSSSSSSSSSITTILESASSRTSEPVSSITRTQTTLVTAMPDVPDSSTTAPAASTTSTTTITIAAPTGTAGAPWAACADDDACESGSKCVGFKGGVRLCVPVKTRAWWWVGLWKDDEEGAEQRM